MYITVYAASSGQVSQVYTDAARSLGEAIAKRGHTLINGAGRTGLMAATTNGCLDAGGQAVGIIPEFMIEQGWEHKGMSQLIIMPDMHHRKSKMAEMSNACIALPGGVGTLEELLEIITWKQLGLYVNPIVILNVDGYYDALLTQLQGAVKENFMRTIHADIWKVATTPTEAMELLLSTPKWDKNIRKFAAI